MAAARWTLYTCGALSLLLLIVSIALLVTHTFMDAVEREVKKAVVLKNGTDVFKEWIDPPLPIYMQFYFFNVSNPMEVLAGEKPVVDEIGPYTYREYRPKEDIEFQENATEVSAVSKKTYIFEAGKSVGNPNTDFIRTINIPIVTLLQMTRNSYYFKYIKPVVNAALKTYKEGMFVTRPVHELLWGYKDPILSLVHTVMPDISDMFGLFYNMNATSDGTYMYLTGSKDYMDFTKIAEWNGKRNLTWWTSSACNMINGTDGTTFHPLINKDEIIYLFSSDLCRSLYATYETSKSVKNIDVFRFVPPAQVYANATVNPDNAGFCVPEGNCLPSGLLNASQCKQGAPIILSPPHFYQTDESVINSIVGMNPNKQDHETFLDIDLLTGMLIQVAKRIQVNVYVRQIADYDITQNIQTLFFPVMYINESTLIDDKTAESLRHTLYKARLVANIPFIIMAFGIIIGLVFIILICRQSRKREEGAEEDTGPLIRTS